VRIAIYFASKLSQYLIYECLQPNATEVTQDPTPEVVDALFTLVFEMEQ